MLVRFPYLPLHRFLYVSLLSVLALHVHANQLLSFEGKVTDLKTSEFLYTERHQVTLDQAGNYLSAQVAYSDPKGKVFAEKKLDYTKNLLAPDMLFLDKRNGEQTHVYLDESNESLNVSIEADDKKEQSSISLDEPLVVVDAGFDRLIESQWASLKKNNTLSFAFLAITRAQLINFEAEVQKTNERSIFVELHPRNFFINMLVEPITLEYDLSTKRLLSFEGLTNIEKFENGKRTEENFVARIEYSYKPLKSSSSQP